SMVTEVETMRASDVLRNEHRAVERVLRVLERAADRLDAQEPVSMEVFEDSLDFLRNFADKCHHAKEEAVLFPAMARAGVPVDKGPIGVMLAEHEEGRAYIRAMVDAVEDCKRGNAAAREALARNARAYASLLEQHIRKEDDVLFPMGDRVLPDADQEALVAEFDRIEAEQIGPGVHERYHQMIDELDQEVPAKERR
ncbi:MAG TPA: hemerythrin domain-containing protein, partial [Chloroflexota bacterium]|nr:hemerythrin domain-containing protein [Chloroflexota bacterium]